MSDKKQTLQDASREELLAILTKSLTKNQQLQKSVDDNAKTCRLLHLRSQQEKETNAALSASNAKLTLNLEILSTELQELRHLDSTRTEQLAQSLLELNKYKDAAAEAQTALSSRRADFAASAHSLHFPPQTSPPEPKPPDVDIIISRSNNTNNNHNDDSNDNNSNNIQNNNAIAKGPRAVLALTEHSSESYSRGVDGGEIPHILPTESQSISLCDQSNIDNRSAGLSNAGARVAAAEARATREAKEPTEAGLYVTCIHILV
jgi:hypothetical protein